MSICPARIAAYKGVHFEVLCALHFAPALIRQSTCSIYPFWQALNYQYINNINLYSMDFGVRKANSITNSQKKQRVFLFRCKVHSSLFFNVQIIDDSFRYLNIIF